LPRIGPSCLGLLYYMECSTLGAFSLLICCFYIPTGSLLIDIRSRRSIGTDARQSAKSCAMAFELADGGSRVACPSFHVILPGASVSGAEEKAPNYCY